MSHLFAVPSHILQISMSVDSVIKSEGAEKKESAAAWVVDKKVRDSYCVFSFQPACWVARLQLSNPPIIGMFANCAVP